jgi:hypothetical protein
MIPAASGRVREGLELGFMLRLGSTGSFSLYVCGGREDGCRRSGGAAAADVLSVLPPTRVLLARSLTRTTALLYGVVASRRRSFGRLVGKEARRRADVLLQALSATSAGELKVRSRSQT